MTESSTFLNRYFGYWMVIFTTAFVIVLNVLEHFGVSVMFAMAAGAILERMMHPVEEWLSEWKETQDRLVNSDLSPGYDRPDTAGIEAVLLKYGERVLLYSGCVFLFGTAWSGGKPPSPLLVVILAAAATIMTAVVEVVNSG